MPHGAVRTYAGGDLDEMARIVREAIEAGAFGFTTSRTVGHRALDGTPVPGTFALEHELQVLGDAVAAAGGRMFEVAPAGLFRSDDPTTVAGEVTWMGRLAERTGLTVMFIMLQAHDHPERWRAEMAEAARWRAAGANVVPLVAARSAAVLYGWDIRHPFMARPTYREIAGRPLAERLVALRDPAIRAAILGEDDRVDSQVLAAELRFLGIVLPQCYALSGDDPDYEQTRRAGARRGGRTSWRQRRGGGVRRAAHRRRAALLPALQLRVGRPVLDPRAAQ